MAASFSIELDRKIGLIALTVDGFFMPDDVVRFARAKAEAMIALGCAPNRHLTLCDVSGCNLQSQSIVEAFRAMVLDRRFMARRFAMVAGGPLARMQTRRILAREDGRCFVTRAEAMAWLTSDDAAAAA